MTGRGRQGNGYELSSVGSAPRPYSACPSCGFHGARKWQTSSSEMYRWTDRRCSPFLMMLTGSGGGYHQA